MAEQDKDKWHKKMAVDCFNLTWDYMDKDDRTAEDDINMINSAHASRYHWTQIGKPLNFQRGEWQIARVYAIRESRTGTISCAELYETNKG